MWLTTPRKHCAAISNDSVNKWSLHQLVFLPKSYLPSSTEETRLFGKLYPGEPVLSRFPLYASLGSSNSLHYWGHVCIHKGTRARVIRSTETRIYKPIVAGKPVLLHLRYPTQRLDILCVCLPHACYSANEPILSPANNLCWGWNIFPVVHQKNWQANKADRCSSDCEDFLVRLFFPRSTNYQSHGRYEYPLSFVCSCKSLAFADVSWWCGKPGSGGLLQWLGLKILPVDLEDGDFNFVTCKVRATNQTWAEVKC